MMRPLTQLKGKLTNKLYQLVLGNNYTLSHIHDFFNKLDPRTKAIVERKAREAIMTFCPFNGIN